MTVPRRRWSFGLRTLFVVVTVAALVVAIVRWMIMHPPLEPIQFSS